MPALLPFFSSMQHSNQNCSIQRVDQHHNGDIVRIYFGHVRQNKLLFLVTNFLDRTSGIRSPVFTFLSELRPRRTVPVPYCATCGHKRQKHSSSKGRLFSFLRCRFYVAEVGTFARMNGLAEQMYQPRPRRFYGKIRNKQSLTVTVTKKSRPNYIDTETNNSANEPSFRIIIVLFA
jgi:hypothetical protein